MKPIGFRIFCITLYALLLVCIPVKLSAVAAYPFPIEVKQPNGEVITIRLHGDEFFHYTSTLDGYLISLDKSGYYTYSAIDDNGIIQPTFLRVSDNQLRSSLSGLIKIDSKEFTEKVRRPAFNRIFEEKRISGETSVLRSSQNISKGNVKGLVILVNFTDKKFVVDQPQQAFTQMLNQPGYNQNGATGSARDYYIDNSNNEFIPTFDVFGPVELPHNMAYYGANDPATGNDVNPEQMVIDACQAANQLYPDLDFANYANNSDTIVDNVFVFYAGYNEAEKGGDNTIWPHRSSVLSDDVKIDGVRLATYACTSELKNNIGNNMCGIGTFTHEFGHVLGLPDLYDADFTANGQGGGLGQWSIMATGNYLNDGRTPPLFSGVERYYIGWNTPQLIEPTNISQRMILNPLSSSNQVYNIETSTTNEFFIVENRKKEGWDSYLPGAGMLIYHIDFTSTRNKSIIYNGTPYTVSAQELWNVGLANIIGEHQCLDLLKANNEQFKTYNGNPYYNQYEGHPYPSGNATSITDKTTPNLKLWNGTDSKVEITNISKDENGIVSFDVKNAINTGIEDIDKNAINVYVQDNYMYVNNLPENALIEVYDISGRKQTSKSGSNFTRQYLPDAGIYVVKIKTSNDIFTYKVLIK